MHNKVNAHNCPLYIWPYVNRNVTGLVLNHLHKMMEECLRIESKCSRNSSTGPQQQPFHFILQRADRLDLA